jgi:hypothetical protein
MIGLLYTIFKYVESLGIMYQTYIYKPATNCYNEIYDQKIVSIASYNMHTLKMKYLYRVTFFDHIRNIINWCCCKQNYKGLQLDIFGDGLKPFIAYNETSHIHEIIMWDGRHILIKNDIVLKKASQKAMYVGLNGVDCTDFVEDFRASFTSENNVTVADIFHLAYIRRKINSISWSEMYMEVVDCNDDTLITNIYKDDEVINYHT